MNPDSSSQNRSEAKPLPAAHLAGSGSIVLAARFLLPCLLLVQGILHAQIAQPRIAPPGLWIGEVQLTHATELGGNSIPTPTKDPAAYRILIHVDANGKTSLLKDVTLATIATTNAGVRTLQQILLTDDQLSQVRPESLNGKPLVQRYGTVAYDWEAPGATNCQRLFEGALGPNRSCQVKLQSSGSSSTNPFRHQRHPEHTLGITLDRTVILRIGSPEPGSMDALATLNRLKGSVEEVFSTQLPANTQPLVVRARGTIALTRVSSLATLNGQP